MSFQNGGTRQNTTLFIRSLIKEKDSRTDSNFCHREYRAARYGESQKLRKIYLKHGTQNEELINHYILIALYF